MHYGITGNSRKDIIWRPLAGLVELLADQQLHFTLDRPLADGLAERGLSTGGAAGSAGIRKLTETCDIILSFGGDGTLLRTAHEVSISEVPILGINIGRLGFLADIEITDVAKTVQRLEQGKYDIVNRSVLDVDLSAFGESKPRYALNECIIERGTKASLIAIEVKVDGSELNTYWADGLIFSTPTGSTAYSLSVGGPIIAPGAGVMVLTPIAPHMLTVRPVVIPIDSLIEATVYASRAPYVVATDGRTSVHSREHVPIRIRQAKHSVKLVKFHDQAYYETLRNKLMWGQGKYRFVRHWTGRRER